MEDGGSVSFAHVATDSQQPVPRGFPLFKRCKWLVVNCNVGQRVPLENGTRTQMAFMNAQWKIFEFVIQDWYMPIVHKTLISVYNEILNFKL